jgi:lysophospholipase L1-like esterase
MRPPLQVAALALSCVALATASACGAEDEIGHGAAYVALGDSYTAGRGMEPVADESCSRSEINYPSLVDKALKIKSFADRSCAGARTENLRTPQIQGQKRVNEPQLNAIGTDTELVTIGMGLNDGAISAGLLLICTTPSSPEPNDVCKHYLDQPQSNVEAQIKAAAARLEDALATIAKKAPKAEIVVVGYPRLVPDHGSCGSPGHPGDLLPVPEAQVTRLRETMKFVNDVWRDTADRAGARYVDMYTPSEGHDICSDDPWVNGYLPVAGKAAGLHPFPAYAEAVAERVVEVLGKD